MDGDRYVDHARAVMREHGFFIQGVAPADPADSLYCYTVGLQRLPVPRPEVIVFGLDGHCAGQALHAVYDRVRAEGPLPRDAVVPGLVAGLPVRVEEVRPEWVEAYAGMVSPLLRRRATDVPMLQLVLPDRAGRWPEDPAADRSLLAGQPLLSHAVPWRVPFQRSATDDLFFSEQPDAELVAVPVHGPVLPEGRYELLRASSVGPETARVSDVPLLADHVAVGDVVQTRATAAVPGLPPGAKVMGAVLEAGAGRPSPTGCRPPTSRPRRSPR